MVTVSGLEISPIKSINPGIVNVTVHSSSQTPVPVQVVVYDTGTNNIIASHNSTSDVPFLFTVQSPKLWSPDSPALYNLTVRMGSDEVDSYTGFRTISKGTVDGVVRPLLNGEFIFMFGTLDQGFWPDGIYTPPSREAMVYDLQVLKNLGFNMLRKHVRDFEQLLEYKADVLKRSKWRPTCFTRLVTKWDSCSYKTCQRYDLYRVIICPIAHLLLICPMRINRRSSIGNLRSS